MSFEMFWGGAPAPLTKDPEALAALREFEHGPDPTRHDSDSDVEIEYYNPQTGENYIPMRCGQNSQDAPKRRVTGGMAAVSKPIVADYDSDDARIIELKQNGFSDQVVANKLKEEGRVRYVSKTVGSRWLRLRKVLEHREDETLDDELSDWHVGEDKLLADIKQEVDKKIDAEIAKLQAKKWQEVSIYLAGKMDGKRKYTARACRERFEANINGTALLPIELDEDQEGRRKLREERITKAKTERAAHYAAIHEAEEARRAKIEAKKQAKYEAVLRKQAQQAQKKAENKERERIRRERLRNRAKARYLREWRLAQMRTERDWELEKIRVEKAVFKGLTGKNLFGKASGVLDKLNKDEYESDDESDDNLANDLDTDEEDEGERSDLGSDGDEDDAERTNFIVADPATKEKRRSGPPRKAKDSKARAKARKEKAGYSIPAEKGPDGLPKALISKQTLLSPRTIMTDHEIALLLHSRGLPRRMKDESHPQVIARLVQADEALNRTELDDLLRHASEKTTGNKPAKLHRLAVADASSTTAGELGIEADDPEFMQMYEGYKDPKWKWVLDEALEKAGMVAEGGQGEKGVAQTGDRADVGPVEEAVEGRAEGEGGDAMNLE